MRELTFSGEDLQAIDRERYHHPHPHVQRKMEVSVRRIASLTAVV